MCTSFHTLMTLAEYDYAYSYPYGHYGHPDEGYEMTYYDENDGCFHYELCLGSIIEPDPHITHRILLHGPAMQNVRTLWSEHAWV